jgi:hypothetical protein
VLSYYEQSQAKGRIRSLAGAIFKALTTDQLMKEFATWKAEQPVYKAPKPKQSAASNEQIVPLDELRSGWEIMKKKGVTKYATFEDSLADYRNNPAYRIETRGDQEYLIFTSS